MKKQHKKTTTDSATPTAPAELPELIENPVMAPATIESVMPKEHVEFLQEKGRAIVSKTGELAGLYYSLVLGIREREIAPRLVSFELAALGLHKVRISEIQRIANSSNDVFAEYEAKSIGFNKALEMARQNNSTDLDKVPTAATKQLMEDGALNEADLEVILEPNGEGVPTERKPKTNAIKMEEAAHVIFKLCSKSKTWHSGDGWKLVLSKDTPVKKA